LVVIREKPKARLPTLLGVCPAKLEERARGGYDLSFVGSCRGHAVSYRLD